MFFSLTDAIQTTLLGGGTGPSAGSKATTCTPAQTNIKTMMAATDGIALNFAFTGKGNDSGPAGLVDQIRAGVAGLKVHEVRAEGLVPRVARSGGRITLFASADDCVSSRPFQDWGSTASAIDNCLSVADEYDIQVNLHSDTNNEMGYVHDTIAAFDNRVVSSYHTEGAG